MQAAERGLSSDSRGARTDPVLPEPLARFRGPLLVSAASGTQNESAPMATKGKRARPSMRVPRSFRWSSTSWIATTGASLWSRSPTTARHGFRSSSIPAATGKTAPIARSRTARLPVDRAACARTRASDWKPGILSLRPDDARGPRGWDSTYCARVAGRGCPDRLEKGFSTACGRTSVADVTCSQAAGRRG